MNILLGVIYNRQQRVHNLNLHCLEEALTGIGIHRNIILLKNLLQHICFILCSSEKNYHIPPCYRTIPIIFFIILIKDHFAAGLDFSYTIGNILSLQLKAHQILSIILIFCTSPGTGRPCFIVRIGCHIYQSQLHIVFHYLPNIRGSIAIRITLIKHGPLIIFNFSWIWGHHLGKYIIYGGENLPAATEIPPQSYELSIFIIGLFIFLVFLQKQSWL